MRRRLLHPLAMLFLAAAFAAACGDDDGSGAAAVAPTSSAGGATTGIREVDAVVRAVHANDVDALINMLRYLEVKCISMPPATGGAPLCSSVNLPNDSILETLPISISEGEYMPRSRVPGFFRDRLERSGFVFYGVLKPERQEHAEFIRALLYKYSTQGAPKPLPDYAVVFQATRTPGLDLAFHLMGGKIVAVQGFGTGALDLPVPNDPAWLIRPPDAAPGSGR